MSGLFGFDGDRVPGAGQTSPVSARPAGTPGIGGMIRANTKRLVLARVNTSGTTRANVAVAATIINPAARLVCAFSLSFDPDTVQAFANYNSSVWSARAMRIGEGGRQAALHEIFTSEALPQLYEVSTAVKVIQISATLTIPLTAAAASVAGNWILEATWEPGIPMCEEEISALYSQTGLSIALAPAGDLAP
jgi:hypothetical protein